MAADDIDITFDARLRGHCQQNLHAFDRLGIDDQTLRLAAVAVVVSNILSLTMLASC